MLFRKVTIRATCANIDAHAAAVPPALGRRPRFELRRRLQMTDIVIVGAARTAIGKFGGGLAKTPAPELGATMHGRVLHPSPAERATDSRSRALSAATKSCAPMPTSFAMVISWLDVRPDCLPDSTAPISPATSSSVYSLR